MGKAEYVKCLLIADYKKEEQQETGSLMYIRGFPEKCVCREHSGLISHKEHVT